MSDIRRYFKSRYYNGVLLEVDFSQLEIIALAYLSGDTNLQNHIKDGLDMHCMNASFLYSARYDDIVRKVSEGDSKWIKRRKTAKGPGFLITYGGGASTMAENTGLTKRQCQTFIDNWYTAYPQVKVWQQEVMDSVLKSRQPANKRTASGSPAGYGEYVSVTGRRYGFYESDTDFRPNPTFSPTQMKNYPVQGFATGDLVPIALGRLNRALAGKNGIKMINTVHDSVLFDCENLSVAKDYYTDVIKPIMENTGDYFNMMYKPDRPFNLQLKVEAEVGKNWLDMVTF